MNHWFLSRYPKPDLNWVWSSELEPQPKSEFSFLKNQTHNWIPDIIFVWKKNQHRNCSSISELSVKSPSVSPPISSSFAADPLFHWYPQSKEVLLNLSMKCWNSIINAQSLRVIIAVVGAVKIYVTAVQALRKNETQDETQFTTKIGGKTSLGPSYFLL
jgi:hypothetical protein